MHGTKFDYSKVDYICMKEKVTIICSKHGDFLQTAHNHLTGSECPSCMNKTEHKLYITLQPTYTSLIRQFRQQWCVHKSMLPFDFCIPELNIIIELDGPQHFRQVMNWQSPEENLKRDKFKTECANANDYSIIRLLQEDVWDDKFDWRKELCDAIEKIRGCDTFLNIYICRNNEYANHAREEYI